MKKDPFSLVLKRKVHYFYIYRIKNRKFIISFINNLKIFKYWVSFFVSQRKSTVKRDQWCLDDVWDVHVKIMIELILYFFFIIFSHLFFIKYFISSNVFRLIKIMRVKYLPNGEQARCGRSSIFINDRTFITTCVFFSDVLNV